MALPTSGSRIFGVLKNFPILTKSSVGDLRQTIRDDGRQFDSARRFFFSTIGGRCRTQTAISRSSLRLSRPFLTEQGRSQRPFDSNRTNFHSGSVLAQQQSNPKPIDASILSDPPQKTAEEEAEENARKKKHLKWSFWGLGIFGSVATVALVCDYGAPKRDEEGNIIEDEYSRYSLIPQYILRFYKEVLSFKKSIAEPSREALLPEPLRAPYRQPPYTLCLEITDVLIKPEWSYSTGWRFKKRPGINFFLQQLGLQSLFEIVIYTKENGYNAYPIIDNIDPQGFIMYRLFRDATRYQDGEHLKDLGALNRPINRVIHVDCDEKAVQLNRSNAVCLKKWDGDMSDRSLVDLAIFLRTIAESGVDDVRGVLEYYSQFEDPLGVFRENQRKLQEQQQESLDTLKSKTMPAWSALKRRAM